MPPTLWGTASAGFLLGASLIIAIGAQNAFVLKLGLQKRHVFAAALICALSDALLITAGVAGFGQFIKSMPAGLTLITFLGAAFLFIYGAQALWRALFPKGLETDNTDAPPMAATVTTILALTFLNPHVYLDTVVLLGGLSAQYEGAGRVAYGIGATTASFVWFFALGFGARFLAPLFKKPASWRILDISIALVMWALATKLLYSHFQL